MTPAERARRAVDEGMRAVNECVAGWRDAQIEVLARIADASRHLECSIFESADVQAFLDYLREPLTNAATVRQDYDALRERAKAAELALADERAMRREFAGWRERAERAEANLAAAERETDRWRHGITIEGDFVCPDSLRADAAEADAKRARSSRC